MYRCSWKEYIFTVLFILGVFSANIGYHFMIAGEDLALIGFFMIPAGIIISVVSVLARIGIHDQAVPVTQLEGIRKGIVSSMGMLHLNLLSALLCANAAMTLLTGILVSKAIENYNWGSTLSFVVVVIIAVILLQDQRMKAHDLKRLEKMQTESEKNVS